MIDISLSLCISVWSIGEGAPEETEKRDDSQRSTLFIEKPQSGSVSVGKCLETKSKATPRDTEPEAERTCSSCDTRLLLSAASTCMDFSWMRTPLFEGKKVCTKRSKPQLFNSRQAQNLAVYWAQWVRGIVSGEETWLLWCCWPCCYCYVRKVYPKACSVP